MDKITIKKMAELIKTPFTPLDLFHVNDTSVRLVKIQGKYHWHKHSNQDELFIVLNGQMQLNFKDKTEILEEGEAYLVKAGIIHQTYSENGALVLMVEPEDTLAKGD